MLAELSKSLPGTPATTLLALVGQRVGGLRGGALAATAFLFPSTMLMIGCGAVYSRIRAAHDLSIFFDGMNAAMVGVVGAVVTIDLARSALRSKRDLALAVLCATLLATRVVSEPILVAAAVSIGAIRGGWPRREIPEAPKSGPLHALPPLATALLMGGSLSALAGLVRVFVPIGIMTFGGGLAMIPAIEHMVVVEQGWLDPKSFADAIALGQITPGPVAICATFIGYRVAGIAQGRSLATFAMFAPRHGPCSCGGAIHRALSHQHHHQGHPAYAGARSHRNARCGSIQSRESGGRYPRRYRSGRGCFGPPGRAPDWRPLWVLAGGGVVRLAFQWLGHH